MLAGIVGFELDVTQWSCKLKLNQHRPESHARMREAYAPATRTSANSPPGWTQLGMEGK